MNPRLIVISGEMKGTVLALSEKSEFSIGREKINLFHFDEPSVSRQHCLIERKDDEFFVRDLESFNGTYVNGIPVHEQAIRHGDQIAVGDILMLFLTSSAKDEDFFIERQTAVFGDDVLNSRSTIRLAHKDAVYLKPEKLLAELPEMARTARDLSVLLKISSILNSIRDSVELQKNLLELIAEIIPAERAAVLLFDEAGEEVAADYVWRKNGDDAKEFQISRTVVESCLSESVSVLSNNVGEDENLQAAESLVKSSVKSVLCVPLTVFKKNLGVIYLDASDAKTVFDRDHLQLLAGIAGIAANPLENARINEKLASEREILLKQIDSDFEMIGESRKIKELFSLITRVAPTDSTILITGESGTGKELAARAVHQNSKRREKPFVAVNCATLTENLLESELFGHERGAFTGAVSQKKGQFELADGGTIFLDEIGELDLPLQAKLLRVLQEREVSRIGAAKTIKINVRVIAATNKNLESAVENKTFREDLFYRLNVINLKIPPLRERADDIPLLVHFFINKYNKKCNRRIKGITADAKRYLLGKKWSGNVRELENAVERGVILTLGDKITLEDLPTDAAAQDIFLAEKLNYKDAVLEAKRKIVEQALLKADNNITEAARSLDIHPNNLHRLLNTLDLREKYNDIK